MDAERVMTGPLAEVLRRLCITADCDPGFVTGQVAAHLARRLIACEVAPGGPYRDESGAIDRDLNRLVDGLFSRLGAPLPAVRDYLGIPESAQARPIRTSRQHTAVQAAASRIVTTYEPPLRATAVRRFESVLRIDHRGEISQLAAWFAASLTDGSRTDTATLGTANLLTWLAYSAYDDCIDGNGSPVLIPVANAAHRDGLGLYETLAPGSIDARRVYRSMDEANAWELAHARFAVTKTAITIGGLPRYGGMTLLARRAGAHVLGPLIITADAGLTALQTTAIHSALDEYLIARQLNDDLHDWVDDLRHGHISPVVAWLLRESGHSGRQPLDDLVAGLRSLFWQRGLDSLAKTALRTIRRSESRLVRSGVMLPDSPFIVRALQPIADSLTDALGHHAQDHNFLKTYAGR